MTLKTGGFRSKTRYKMNKTPRARGKIPLTKLLQRFKIGDRVIIEPEPSVHKAMPFPKFKARTGVVVGQQGRAYKVQFTDGGKTKHLLAGPAHLVRAK